MAKTINGLTPEEVLKQLEADIPVIQLKRTWAGYAYFAIQTYQERLNAIVGLGHYDYIEDGLCTTTVGGVTAVNIRGTIVIRYDDGSEFLRRSSYGSENVGVRGEDKPEKAGEPNDLSNSIKAAGTDAFVQCCRKLGIAEKQLRAIREADKHSGKDSSEKGKNTAPSKYRVKFGSTCNSIGDKGYKLSAQLEGQGNINLKIWVDSEAYKQIVDRMGTIQNFVSKCKGSDVTVIGKKGSYKGEPEIEVGSFVMKQSA